MLLLPFCCLLVFAFCMKISMIISAKDWTYAGEGKVRIAFSNRVKHSSLFGTLLLITKDGQQSVENDSRFIDTVMKTWFTESYISDTVRPIMLDSVAVCELFECCSTLRPLQRVLESPLTNFTVQKYACLQRNLSLICRKTPASEVIYKDELSLELKVKCGLKAVTPFVCASSARLKLEMSRFHLMQLYKQAQKGKSVGWGKFVSVNSYDPLMMFSGDHEQILRALKSLQLNPQNNLRVLLNAQHIYGWDKANIKDMTDAVWKSEFREESEQGQPVEDLLLPERVVTAVAVTLAEEPVLSRLLSMQQLDLLDSEGAEVVFSRLVEIVQSREAAVGLLEEQMLRPLHPLVGTRIHRDEQSCAAGHEDQEDGGGEEYYEDEDNCIVMARDLISLNISEGDADAERMQRHEKARALIGAATARQCLFLLQLWMLALIAKDASVIITLRRVRLAALNTTGRGVGDMWVSHQSVGCCGSVCSTTPNPDSGHFDGYAYTVAVIDIGLKSLDKPWKKAAEDAVVCQIVADCLQKLS